MERKAAAQASGEYPVAEGPLGSADSPCKKSPIGGQERWLGPWEFPRFPNHTRTGDVQAALAPVSALIHEWIGGAFVHVLDSSLCRCTSGVTALK